MNKHLKTLPIVITSALLLNGCVTQQPAPPPQTTQVQCMLPKIEVIADKVNQQTQSKGGLDITIVPALYKTVSDTQSTIRYVEPSFSEKMLNNYDPKTTVFVEQTLTPLLKPTPNRVVFTIKVHNQLNRVFHGQGSVVQFNVDGKLIPFNNTDYKEFVGGIVPPNNDADLVITGPPLDALKDKGTITVFLYDVVTDTDTAGNTTAKQNYTWDFSYTMQPVTETGTIQVKRGTMNINAYARAMQEQKQRAQPAQSQAGNSLIQ